MLPVGEPEAAQQEANIKSQPETEPDRFRVKSLPAEEMQNFQILIKVWS